MRVLVIGAGWAGLAAAIHVTQAGHHATVLEAARAIGGRARALNVTLPSGLEATLDNGQHIMIGAYSDTLRLMQTVGVDVDKCLLRMPLTLRYPDGSGLQLPSWKKPWFAGVDVATGILRAKGWSLGDKISLLRAADAWRRSNFICAETHTVANLCKGISPRVMTDMIDPLVVSALNTPTDRASGQVFLRIMRDSLFANSDAGPGSNLLLPKADLGQLFPTAAWDWLRAQGADLHTGVRLQSLQAATSANNQILSKSELLTHIPRWQSADLPVKTDNFDAVIVATPAADAARIVRTSLPDETANSTQHWLSKANTLQYEAITTVYAHSPQAKLAQPMLALRNNAQEPAQFVFDRGQLTGHIGLLAFVVSASSGDAATLEQQVIAQGRAQLNLPDLQPVKTIVDKRATFACTPALERPGMHIAPGLLACGDYVDGPYPSTLEGAVRSGLAAAKVATGLGYKTVMPEGLSYTRQAAKSSLLG